MADEAIYRTSIHTGAGPKITLSDKYRRQRRARESALRRNFAPDFHVLDEASFAETLSEVPMPTFAYAALSLALATTIPNAQTQGHSLQATATDPSSLIVKVHHEDGDRAPPAQMLTSLPSDTWPATNWYKQNVYDRTNNKIGEILDVLVDHGGKNVAVIIGVGGFLGVGEKDVAVPFDAVHFKKKDNRWQAILNTTKEALRNAPGYKCDRNAQSWIPENASGTTGGSNRR